MKKKFKTKTTRKLKQKYKNILIYIIIIITLIISLNYLSKIKINKIDIKNILKYSNNLETHNIKNNLIKTLNLIIKIDINNPKTIIQNKVAYKEITTYKPNMKLVYEPPKKTNDPLIYIYNTHPTETYIDGQNSIKTATYYMKEKLEQLGINTLLSTDNITQMIYDNNWTYDDSYKASRIELERIKQEYPSIKIFIDLHRDGLKKEYSTTTIEGKNYAKILFLVGKEHENYLNNLEFTTSINEKIKTKYPTITRGVHQMEGPGVHGIYNQDLAPNVILLEMGGNENTYEEVINTIDLITPIIKEKIDEK